MANGAPSRTTVILAVMLAAVLSDCGGGSSDSGSPPVPPVPTGPPGTLDATFGNGGVVVATPGPSAAANALALQPDGKIVVAGSIGEGAAKSFLVARYNTDGTLDARFGAAGSVTTSFDPASGSEARAVALQPDGRILAVGGSAGACALARYNVDGTLDTGFGVGGVVLSRSARDEVTCMGVDLQSDGRIVVAVDHGPLDYGSDGRDGSVMRFVADGSRDASFGTGGEAIVDCGFDTDPGFSCRVASIVVRPQGGLVIGGAYWFIAPFGGAYSFMVGQLMPDGSPDTHFGERGYWTSRVTPSCTVGALALQPDGKIVAEAGEETCLFVVRLVAEGTIDAGFGAEGVAQYPNLGAGVIAAATVVALQANGKIIAAGHIETRAGDGSTVAPPAIAVYRFLTGGTLDPAFGSAGVAKTPLGTSAGGRAVAIMADGRIVVAGSLTTAAGTQQVFVARYFGDPS